MKGGAARERPQMMDAQGNHSIRSALAAVDRAGLRAPATMTLKRQLEVLAETGVLPDVVARRFLAIHDEAEFSQSGLPSARTQPVCDELTSALRNAVENAPDSIKRARIKLDERTSVPLAAPAHPQPSRDSAEPRAMTSDLETVASILELPTNETPPAQPHDPSRAQNRTVFLGPLELRMSRRQRQATALSLLLFVALTAAAVGYAAHDRIAWGLHVLTSHVLDLPFSLGSSEGHLDQARRLAGANPESVPHWRRYADLAARYDRPAETVVALRRMISLQPESAQLLNELAWLLCTSTELSVRNPEQALELAERAYVMTQVPAITDTLAEAAFLNGQTERAVVLAEQALAGTTRNKVYYQDQLERFRAALGDELR